LPDRRLGPDERNALDALGLLASESRVYRMHLEDAKPFVERLAADMDDVAVGLLLTSGVTALDDRLGSPLHVEQLARRILHGLKP
jgi:hypothetical protein